LAYGRVWVLASSAKKVSTERVRRSGAARSAFQYRVPALVHDGVEVQVQRLAGSDQPAGLTVADRVRPGADV
jgi:hypothetical protein